MLDRLKRMNAMRLMVSVVAVIHMLSAVDYGAVGIAMFCACMAAWFFCEAAAMSEPSQPEGAETS